MIRFKGSKGDRTVIGLGITEGNIERLKLGEPIYVTSESVELDQKIDFCIFYGKDIAQLNKMMEPALAKDAKITIDPLLKAGVPEDARTTKDGQNRA